MPEPPLWDDSYDGPRWTYGMVHRPAAYANLPNGWIIGSIRSHPDFPHGTVQFPRKLSLRHAMAFELTLIEAPA